MKGFAAVLFLLPLLASAVRLSSKVTPTEKVITMLSEMHAKGEKMMDEEKAVFAKYTEWVDDKVTELGFEIKTATSKIEELIAFIEKADSDVEQLGIQIEELDSEITKLTAEKKEATAIRAEERAEYVKVSTDYGESVDALERAIQVMESENTDQAQAESLLQRMATTVPGTLGVLNAFIQQKSAASQPGAPEVAAYEFQSGGIIEMLEGLLKKFKGELADVEQAESNQKHAFEMEELHLTDTIEYSTSQREEKAITKGKKSAASAEAKGELAETKADKQADEELKAETSAVYKEKTVAYEENQKVRVAELEAISKALEIIKGGAVAGAYKKRVNLAQTESQSAPAFIQLGRSKRRVANKELAAAFLRKQAKALNSKTLAAFAETVPANAFNKVIGMIEDLITKLKEEAAQEADHKAWCDEQLKTNKLKRNKKTAQSEKLNADIEAQTSAISTLGEEIETLIKEQADLTKAMQEATKLREEEKAENTAIIADAKGGIEAVGNALVVLKEFYSAQGAFIQEQQVPEMASYKGMQSGKGGVIGMLEVILSDFGRLKSETTVAEATAAKEYDAFMAESTASKEVKHKSEVQKKLDKDQIEFEKSQNVKDLKAVDKELAKANEYFESLKPACLEVHVSYEERVAARKAEIQALKDAYEILDKKSA